MVLADVVKHVVVSNTTEPEVERPDVGVGERLILVGGALKKFTVRISRRPAHATTMDCVWDNISLEASPSLNSLSDDQIRVIKKASSNDEYLDNLAAAALCPHLTTAVLASYEPLFPDLCARWIFHKISPRASPSVVLAAFARVLPVAPQLAILTGHLLSTGQADTRFQVHADDAFLFLSAQQDVDPRSVQVEELRQLLLAFFRLLHFDYETFVGAVSPARLQQLFGHDRSDVRYLAVRLFCMRVKAADALTYKMVSKHVGTGAIQGVWEGRTINYRFLALWEEKLAADRQAQLNESRVGRLEHNTSKTGRIIRCDDLSPWTGNICGVLLPRLCNTASKPSTLILTTTAAANARSLANALKSSAPVVVIGCPGSGRTATVLDIAREIGVEKDMLILHLNEQTDAKMLVGMYTTGSTPGSFKWRPGVLSIAAQEGRWVLIEDLDRAPADVIQVLLPLLSRSELMIASQGQKIRAASGFRLLATVRSSSTFSGSEQVPSFSAFGEGLWNQVRFRMLDLDEFREIIASRYHLLKPYLPTIMRIYGRVQTLYQDRYAFIAQRTDARWATARDLLRFCSRLDVAFRDLGLRTGMEPLPETAEMNILAEAVDCFAGYQPSQTVRQSFIDAIGEELHISPKRVQHHSQTYTPSYRNLDDELLVGRARLPKRKREDASSGSRKRRATRSFVATKQTLRLLEQVGTAIRQAEPVLLVGETGTGKTAVVQHLAETLGHRLTVLNLSQQSESGDLLGSYKPVSTRSLVIPLKEQFETLFESTFVSGKNRRYIELVSKYIAKEQWHRVLKMWEEAVGMAKKSLDSAAILKQEAELRPKLLPKKRKRSEAFQDDLRSRWRRFSDDLKPLEKQLSGDAKPFAFKFMEGAIVRAARDGDWVLLDEINLAPPDTLESLASLLSNGSTDDRFLLLTESGGVERVQAHPNFRILGAMNPATDVGKRDLPPGLRARFSEIYVEGPDGDFDDLIHVLKAWLGQLSEKDNRMAHDIARFYLSTKQLMKENRLASSTNDNPHFSLRTLTRTLNYVTTLAPLYGIRRAMYEAFSMSFLAHLDNDSQRLLVPVLDKYIIGNGRTVRSMLKQTPRLPDDGQQYIQFEHHWVLKGDFSIEPQPHYIITPSVRRNLLNLVLAMSIRQFPVLLQGPTSSGKTSMITYLAKITGNKCVRINNHEHTDLQEYIGAYSSDSEGQLHFQEGVLVRALREGHWIILDELNLAPTDVLEALNRLLDDNRELMIPETQEVVRPHPNFVLFATQNPPGLYGGRKILSRAFRTRFVELYFGEIPESELEVILQERTQIAPSYCTKIVSVYKELLLLRQSDRLFEHRNSYMTLRDLFRWALRKADDREEVAINGFMLIAERVRKPEEKAEVKRIIERVFKVGIDEDLLYGMVGELPNSTSSGIVWTKAMRRLYHLVSKALENNEPVLLVGETGCGKTSLCQFLAGRSNKRIHIVNAQQNTETGDLTGAQRPLRNKSTIEEQLRQDLLAVFNTFMLHAIPDDTATGLLRDAYKSLSQGDRERIPVPLREKIATNLVRSKALFEWVDGALVQAMKQGEFFLLDEISLAEDSTLERLNSVLEPNRTILLAEKGSVDSVVQAASGFQFLATMNPGGDFGKRELSPALRNRFTEIWVPPISDDNDLLEIATARLAPRNANFARPVVRFARWFQDNFGGSTHSSLSIRDALAWIDFMNRTTYLEPFDAYIHGAALVYVDSLGANPAALVSILPHNLAQERRGCLDHLRSLVDIQASSLELEIPHLGMTENSLSIGPFSMSRGAFASPTPLFRFDTPTTRMNLLRIVRALELQKPILLEGNPGVGKTSLVTALAETVGRPLTRINLSEQTDLIDLFGSDAPVQGAQVGTFAWRDGPFLQAMQRGEWVLLDELNLASQSVLEGLNSCFDHRGEIYLSELDQTFSRHPQFTIFTTQNPYSQGAGRKGLPASFVNRFSVVYVDTYVEDDLLSICKGLFPSYGASDLRQLLDFISALYDRVVRKRQFGSQGGPWDFNLRDVTRWLQVLTSDKPLLSAGNAADFLSLIISQRFRTNDDKRIAASLFLEYCGQPRLSQYVFQDLGFAYFQAGLGLLSRNIRSQPVRWPASGTLGFEPSVMQSVTLCVQMNWPCILVGPSGSGKGRLVKYLASIAGADLFEITLDSNTDTMDFVGGYEQMDFWRQARQLTADLEDLLLDYVRQVAPAVVPNELLGILERLQSPLDSENQLQQIQDDLIALDSNWPSFALSTYIRQCGEYIQLANHPEQARFDWVDGVLIKALQRGAWVILRQANLCTPSVLDRLNSLLEPNGSLIVSEKQDSQGGTMVIRPHQNFRVFLTMDPRHGEMSRAMRNRSVEIYMTQSAEPKRSEVLRRSIASTYDSGASQYQPLTALCNAQGNNAQFASQLEAAIRRLSVSDLDYLDMWRSEVVSGLSTLSDQATTAFHLVMDKIKTFKSICGGPESPLIILHRLEGVLPDDFLATQPIDPLANEALLSFGSSRGVELHAYWAAFLQDVILETLSMESTLDAQRKPGVTEEASVKRQIARLQAAAWTAPEQERPETLMLSFLRAIHQDIQRWAVAARSSPPQDHLRQTCISEVIACWHESFEAASGSGFDTASFLTHVQLWQTISVKPINTPDSVSSLLQSIAAKSVKIGSMWQLSTGLSMERLWSVLRPARPQKSQSFEAFLQLEQLAQRVDELIWSIRQPLSEIVSLIESVGVAFQRVLLEDTEWEGPLRVSRL